MGNCWRMPEDHLNLLRVPSINYAPLDLISPSSTSDISIPKLIIGSHPSNDIHRIKAAKCRNLFEHLPLICFDQTKIQQTECAICLVDFVDDEHLRQLPCYGAHVFHSSCIEGWLEKSSTCPTCSSNVDATVLLKFIPHFDDDE